MLRRRYLYPSSRRGLLRVKFAVVGFETCDSLICSSSRSLVRGGMKTQQGSGAFLLSLFGLL